MKKTASIFILFSFIIGQLSAQFLDKIQLKGGLMYEFVTFQQAFDSTYTQFGDPVVVPYVNFLVGGYYDIAHKNDIVSVGIDAGVQGGLYLQQGFAYQIQVPTYVMGRIGAGSTTYNQQKIGAGVGIGMQSTYLNESRLGTPNTIKTFIFVPSAIGEVMIGGGNLTGRLHIPLLPMKKQLEAANNGYYKLTNVGLGLIYRF